MKKLVCILLLASLASSGQASSSTESLLSQKANAYLKASTENNRFELPTAQERKSMKNVEDIRTYSIAKAHEVFELLVGNYPSSKSASSYYYQLGALEYQMRSFEKSKASLEKSIALDASKSYFRLREAHIVLAKIAVDEKKFAEAREYLNTMGKEPKHLVCGNELFGTVNELKPLYDAIAVGLGEK